MPTAVMLLTDNRGRYRQPVSVQVKLQYVFAFPLEIRRWSCRPSFLPAFHGYWTETALGESISLYDDKDRKLGFALGMDISWYGYSFNGMKGESGIFLRHPHGPKGGVLRNVLEWKLISV